MTTILKFPEGVSELMENLWLRHQFRLEQSECKVFIVDLPPLSAEEKARLRCNQEQIDSRSEYSQDELFGAWI